MKKFIIFFGIFLCVIGNAQTTNITYTASNAVISNPERGFYKHTSTHNANYASLNQTILNNYRLNENITLIYRNFEIDSFVNSPITETYLAKMQSDFNKIRNAGLKCIIRFTYSDNKNVSQRDASKSRMLSHILQLKPLFISNVDIICAVQSGFIGTWGEWYFTSQPEFGGWGYNETELTTTNINNRKDIVNALLNALPLNRMVQIRKPTFKQDLYTPTALQNSQAFSETNLARIGHHNDCFLATSDDNGTYDNVTTEYPYLAQETKFLPMGGETCDLNSPRTDCTTALFEMNKFHWSYLNLDYYPDVIDGFESGNCFSTINKNLGYRFELKTATLQNSVALNNALTVTLKIKNVGYAAPFNERNVYIVLKNVATNQIYPILMNTDPRLWLGPNEITITENLTLPNNLTTGNYKMYLHLPDNSPSIANRPEYAIRLANDSVWESFTGYNSLNHTISVTNATLGIIDNAKFNISMFPVPSDSILSIDLDAITDYQVTVYNSIGQKVSVVNAIQAANKMTINTQNLSSGLYFVEFVKDNIRDTRKIIVKH